MCQVRSAGRGTTLLGMGFVLALRVSPSRPRVSIPRLALAGVAAGVVLGWLVGFATKIEPWPGIGPLLAGAGGVVSDAGCRRRVSARRGLAARQHARARRRAARGRAWARRVAGVAALVLRPLAAFGRPRAASGQPAAVALAASASGLASAMVGFALGNPIVVTVGGLVATAGLTLAAIVGAALEPQATRYRLRRGQQERRDEYSNVKACGAEETAMVLGNRAQGRAGPRLRHGRGAGPARPGRGRQGTRAARNQGCSTPFILPRGSFPDT